MDLEDFQNQVRRCAQTEEEITTFIRDMARVRLRFISGALFNPQIVGETTLGEEDPPAQNGVDWNDPDLLRESGLEPEELETEENLGNRFLHVDTAVNEPDWNIIQLLLQKTLLSEKQKRALFPILNKTNRPRSLYRRELTREDFAKEVQRLNSFLKEAEGWGLDQELINTYQASINIHGKSQNVTGSLGAAGGIISVVDAVKEINPSVISDVFGGPLENLPHDPIEIYEFLYEQQRRFPQSLLLRNGRAIVFATDPDVAIFQKRDGEYGDAEEALRDWEFYRRQVQDRHRYLHIDAVGEIKTAADQQNLHERLALGSRETRDEIRTDRFLLMAILTEGVIAGTGEGTQRRGTGIQNRDVERFSDVFNLYYAWGYDNGRTRHPEHWESFKERLTLWCGL